MKKANEAKEYLCSIHNTKSIDSLSCVTPLQTNSPVIWSVIALMEFLDTSGLWLIGTNCPPGLNWCGFIAISTICNVQFKLLTFTKEENMCRQGKVVSHIKPRTLEQKFYKTFWLFSLHRGWRLYHWVPLEYSCRRVDTKVFDSDIVYTVRCFPDWIGRTV